MTLGHAIGGALRRLNWKPSPLKLLGVKPAGIDVDELPTSYAITGFPTDYDQGQLGSCGPNALAEIYEHDLGAKFSRLWAYWWTRAVEKDIDQDAGVTIPDLLHVGQSMGLPLERDWDYDVTKYQEPPPMWALGEAVKHRVQSVDIVADLDHLLFELARDQPVIFGFNAPRSMMDLGYDGVVNVPGAGDPSIGGHCVVAHAYDRARGLVKTTSHYGPTFGDRGCLWLPFAHFTSGNACDMRAVRSIS